MDWKFGCTGFRDFKKGFGIKGCIIQFGHTNSTATVHLSDTIMFVKPNKMIWKIKNISEKKIFKRDIFLEQHMQFDLKSHKKLCLGWTCGIEYEMADEEGLSLARVGVEIKFMSGEVGLVNRHKELFEVSPYAHPTN